MAYEKQTWQCGDTITADKLNHMEDGIASGGGSTGYSCEVTRNTLFDGSVTTVVDGNAVRGQIVLSETPSEMPDPLFVTWNGVEYEVSPDASGWYGAPYDEDTDSLDWSTYPFAIYLADPVVETESAGTYTLALDVEEETITTTPCFEKAVRQCGRIVVSLYGDGYGSVEEASMTARDVKTLLDQGVDVVLHKYPRLDSSDFEVEYFMKKDPSKLYYYDSVYGNIYRFSGLAFSYDNGGEEVVHPGYHTDIFNPDGTNEYYWVYNDYYPGKHE